MQVNRFVTLMVAMCAFVLSAATSLVVIERYGVFTPRPYWVDSFEWRMNDEGLIEFHGQFLKFDGCIFDKIVVRGTYLGVVDPVPIPHRDVDGPQGDREAGLHSLNFLLGPLRQDYEEIEVKTRHICGGALVTRTFAKFEIK